MNDIKVIYFDEEENLSGTCKCGYDFKNLVISRDNMKVFNKNDYATIKEKCPNCLEKILVRKLDIVLDLSALKSMKNKLERRCYSVLLNETMNDIITDKIGYLEGALHIKGYEKSYNNFVLEFLTDKYYIRVLDIILFTEYGYFKGSYEVYENEKLYSDFNERAIYF
ncbi:MAG: hypothetical protein ACRC41_13595 [Sarcina sp.]